ncbi:MAG TPA: dihydroorotase [Rhodospirillales bacterium]|nr:dihydroorotase [Rhodospirillales bacterium]
MAETYDLILRNGACIMPGGGIGADIGVRKGKIATIGNLAAASAAHEMDIAGLVALPGVIDTQVHFREPGMEHKEDFSSGTASAALGGVTAVFEMPNTDPPTGSAEALADKCRRAKDRAWCDMAFYVGATEDNIEKLPELERLPGCAGVKIFMGSSTGGLLVKDDKTLAQVLASGSRRCAVHCEDEESLNKRKSLIDESIGAHAHPVWRDEETAALAVERLLKLARATNRRVHVLHVSSGREMELLAENHDIATVEATPQHLSLAAPDAYDLLGSKAQMNPPIRDKSHRDRLWEALRGGLVDCIGSDHAPHTLEEKAKPYPQSPSGMPGVQTLVPVMLNHVAAGMMSLERFVDLTSAGPARIFSIAGKGRIALGYDADFTIIDPKAKNRISNMWIASRCGWTPFDGLEVTGWPVATVVRGNIVMREGELLGEPIGTAVRFLECL